MIKNSNVQGLKYTIKNKRQHNTKKKKKKIKDNITKDVRNLFKLKKEAGETTTKDVKNHFLIYIKFEWKHQ